MGKTWKIFSKKDEKPHIVQNDNSAVDPLACSHGGLIIAKTKGSFTNKEARMYICLRCGYAGVWMPAEHLEKIPGALEYMKKLASEIRLPKLRTK